MKSRPNVVFIISDDTELGYLGFSGGATLSPTLDRLAREGVTFRRHYTAGAVCMPSRYSYITGRHVSRTAEPKLKEMFPPPQCPEIHFKGVDWKDEDHLGTTLGAAGYYTGYVGKIHVDGQKDFPMRKTVPGDGDPYDKEIIALQKKYQQSLVDEMKSRGFDFAASIAWGNLPDGGPGGVHNLEWTTKGALDFLDAASQKDDPFFLWFATSVSHGPNHIDALEADPRLSPGGLLDEPLDIMPKRDTIIPRLKEAGVPVHHRTAGVLWLDDAVNALHKKLQDLGLDENTIIIYTTDHNEIRKATLYERGVHIPMLMNWKGTIAGGQDFTQLSENIDVAPTIMECCGIEKPEGMFHDGISLYPALVEGKELDRDDLFFENGLTRGVVTSRYKYFALRYPQPYLDKMKNGAVDKAFDHFGSNHLLSLFNMRFKKNYWDYDQLYDLVQDPDEENNLAQSPQYAEILEDMKGRLMKYVETMDYTFDIDNTDFLKSQKFRDLAQAHTDLGPESIDWYVEEDYIGKYTFPPKDEINAYYK